ncbi:MAG TPA: Uma2 family endonuclease [Planctomycetaceae bacterium]|nr:Uma2 family endonuclease [Planctomycetaceae bacterium]
MSTVATTALTGEDLLVLPDDAVERDIIRGELRERPVTRRNPGHSTAMTRLARFLDQWLDGRPQPQGRVLAGDAAFRLGKDPETTVGIDVAYVSYEQSVAAPIGAALVEGPPLLAAEILSPSDTHEGVVEKPQLYLDLGVAAVWILDPDLRTVTVHRRDADPAFFNAAQELTGDPELPGFRVRVVDLFGRAPLNI